MGRPWAVKVTVTVTISFLAHLFSPVQFVFSGVMSVPLVWEQVTSKQGCAGFGAWAFNVAFNLSLLALFVDFHRRNYGKKKAQAAKDAKKDK